MSKGLRKLLLIPSIPTPNGRLHLGHIAGPFLKMDIIKRFSQQIGNKAYLYGGTDPHDSYVLLKALQMDKRPEDICNYYYEAILTDLEKMYISFDGFINPLDLEIYPSYSKITQDLTQKLIDKNKVCLVKEKYPYSVRNGYLPPSFISGVCSFCSNKITGFICEQCGLPQNPENILNKQYNINEIYEKNIQSWFLPVDTAKIIKNLSSKKMPEYARKIVMLALDIMNNVRITIPTNWGISLSENSVCYNYGTFFPYCVLLAEICKQNHRLSENAFDISSDVEIVTSFGLDNIITFAINSLNHALALDNYKDFSYYLPNNFMTLNGKKFSTSRNHAIWVNKINKNISIDIIRLYLAKNNADIIQSDFNIDEFVIFYNDLVKKLNEKFLNDSIKKSENIEHNFFEQIFSEKFNFLMPENYSGKKICDDINRWLSMDLNQTDWLAGFAIIAYPIMPKISLSIWQSLGNTGIPFLSDYSQNSVIKGDIKLLTFINKNDIEVG